MIPEHYGKHWASANLLRPGDETVTFDESWLLALLRPVEHERMILPLMASRVAPRYRPNLQYLMSQLSHLLRTGTLVPWGLPYLSLNRRRHHGFNLYTCKPRGKERNR